MVVNIKDNITNLTTRLYAYNIEVVIVPDKKPDILRILSP